MLDAATTVTDLHVPPGNRLEQRTGSRAVQPPYLRPVAGLFHLARRRRLLAMCEGRPSTCTPMAWWKRQRKMTVRFGVFSDVGRVREENQDAYGCFEARPDGGEGSGARLFIVADGMGGHTHGGQASRLAVRVVQKAYFAGPGQNVQRRLRQALVEANASVYQQSQRNGGLEKMGTTCTALALRKGQAYLAHVGDSRAYRLRGEAITQMTHDHTLVHQMQREGLLTEQEMQTHPRRHVLMRALGVGPELEVDCTALGPARPGDRFLLCSDGLEAVMPEEMQQIIACSPPQQACEALVALANERGGRDNSTAMVIVIQA